MSLLIKLWLTHSRTAVISHSCCEHMAMVKLDLRINKAYRLFVAFSVLGFDVIFIFLSYVFIFQAVFKLHRKRPDSKHSTYAQLTFLSFSSPTSSYSLHLLYIDLALMLLLMFTFCSQTSLVPALLNPIVYRLKTKKIQERVIKMFASRD